MIFMEKLSLQWSLSIYFKIYFFIKKINIGRLAQQLYLKRVVLFFWCKNSFLKRLFDRCFNLFFKLYRLLNAKKYIFWPRIKRSTIRKMLKFSSSVN